MARQNLAFLYGRVSKPPVIRVNNETGEYTYATVFIDVVRSKRSVDDDVNFVKHDLPLVLSSEKEIIDIMRDWKENTIVYIKGTLTTKRMVKTSYCEHCTDEDGNATVNKVEGNIVYITPIYVRTVAQYETKQEAIEDIVKNREISNQIFVMGTLLNDPKLITTKQKIQITQYRLAINRKYTIRSDDPSVKTDWPVVKSYGEQARDDKLFLQYQADVFIDGFIQARTVNRKQKCACCGKLYEWKDKTMELVPFSVEYVSGHKSKEEVEAEHKKTLEEARQKLFNDGYKDEIEDDLKSNDID